MSTFPREVWLAYAAIAALLGLQAFLPVLSPPPAPPAVGATAIVADVVSPGAIELTRIGDDVVSATVLVRNDSNADGQAQLDAVAVDRHGNPLTASATHALPRAKTTALTIALPVPGLDRRRDDRLPARGTLTLRVTPAGLEAPVTIKPRELIVPQVQPSFAEMQITLVGLGAGAIVLLFGLVVAKDAKPNPKITGTPTWTPQSWSTNLAIGGALLTAVLGIAGLPAQGYYATKSSYMALSVFFAALVALAPAVYGLLKVGEVSAPTALRLFAFAAAVTVWATVGQLGTAALLSLELGKIRVFSTPAAIAAGVLFWVIAALVWLYAMRAVYAYSTADGTPVPAKVPAVPGGPVPPPGTAPAEWPLL